MVVAVAAVAARWQGSGGGGNGGTRLAAKVAGNESIDGRMTACKKADGGQRNNQPNKGVVKVGGGGGSLWRQ
jgi:hypothetical protein